jgi:RNA polymerase sigma-70 factor (ECF subfamily)
MHYSDEELIIAYQDGDPEALKILIERYTSHIYNFVYKLGAGEEAADVTQEVFLKVWKNLKRFDAQKASFKTWLFTIARNATTDYLRKKKTPVFSDMEREDATESFEATIPDQALLQDEVLIKIADEKVLKDVITKLPPAYQSMLTLYYQEEMTFDEIGKVLGKPLNTVKSWHRRALIRLRELLD